MPPANVPEGFQLGVTSVAGATDPTVLGTATCTVAGGAFTCDYRDASAPAVPQGGLLVQASSLLTATETDFPGNTVVSPVTIPATLPATGSTDARPMGVLALLLVPIGAGLVLATRRRSRPA